jgi:hypothetical protein
MEASQAQHEQAPHGQFSAFAFWILVSLLIVYPLSIGPVARVVAASPGLPPQALLSFYKPLETLYDNSYPAERFFDWYLKLWNPMRKQHEQATTHRHGNSHAR